jgi:enamine deaminase RidA (YjgF/YER057c/UK114 family)
MAELEARLDPAVIARVHRSAFVRLGAVRRLKRPGKGALTLVLEDEVEVQVGPNYTRACGRRWNAPSQRTTSDRHVRLRGESWERGGRAARRPPPWTGAPLMNPSHLAAALIAMLGLAGPASSGTPADRIPAPGGEVVITDAKARAAYDRWRYAPARRAGDYVYISGVVIARAADGPHTPDTFAAAAREGFGRIRALLAGFGLTFDDVVMVNSFHDWSAPEFRGDRLAQFEAFNAVKDEYMKGVHPAWTAVGTSGLISPQGIVEVQMIAYAPQRRRETR